VGNKDSALASLNRAAGVMGVANGNYWVIPFNPEGSAGILIMAAINLKPACSMILADKAS
jgi:hypothetical protein